MPASLPNSAVRGAPIRADDWNLLVGGVRGGRLQPGAGLRAHETRNGMVPERRWPADASRPYQMPPPPPFGPTHLWGLLVEGTTAKIYPGAIRRAGVIKVSPGMEDNTAVEVAITAEATWTGWEFDPVENSLIVMPAASAAMPEDGDGLERGPLFHFGYSAADAEAGIPAAAWLIKDWSWIIPSGLFG